MKLWSILYPMQLVAGCIMFMTCLSVHHSCFYTATCYGRYMYIMIWTHPSVSLSICQSCVFVNTAPLNETAAQIFSKLWSELRTQCVDVQEIPLFLTGNVTLFKRVSLLLFDFWPFIECSTEQFVSATHLRPLHRFYL